MIDKLQAKKPRWPSIKTLVDIEPMLIDIRRRIHATPGGLGDPNALQIGEAIKVLKETEAEAVWQSNRIGDVYQIVESHGRSGWIGSFVLATEIKRWGIQGFVCVVESHDKRGHAFIRLKWKDIAYIGRAVLVPGDEDDRERFDAENVPERFDGGPL